MTDAGMHYPFTIAVAGGTGSGKTTIASALIDRIGSEHIAYLPHDAYYKNREHLATDQNNAINFDHPNSLDTPLMVEHIKQLQAYQTVHIPIYDFAHDRRTEKTITVQPNPIILVEGILILSEPELRKLFDIKIFVDTDADLRFIRRLKRDIVERGRSVESVIDQYLQTVRPMHTEFVDPSRRHADVIIPQGGYNTVAIDMVADRIRAMIHRTPYQPRPPEGADQ